MMFSVPSSVIQLSESVLLSRAKILLIFSFKVKSRSPLCKVLAEIKVRVELKVLARNWFELDP